MTRASDTARLLGAGATILDGTTISTADNTEQLTLTSTDADANAGPELLLDRNSSSPADADRVGKLTFKGRNDANQTVEYGNVQSRIIDASDGTEDGRIIIQNIIAGDVAGVMESNGTETIFNENSKDLDFRVESNGNANMLFVDGGNDIVGIGVVPTAQFSHNIIQIGNQASLGANAALSTTGQTYLTHNLYYNTDGNLRVFNTSGANEGAILQMVDGTFKFSNSSATTGTPTVTERIRVGASTGNFFVGTTSTSPNPGVCVQASGAIGVGNSSGSSGTNFMEFRRSATQIGSIQQSGTTGVAFQTSSDYRLKENVAYDFDATTRLKQLKPCRFNFIAEADRTVDGFLAHEVQSVVPEAIHGTKDAMTDEVLYVDGDDIPDGKEVGDVKEASTIDPQQIDQSKLVPLLVKTIQELEARITALENGE